MDHPWRRGLVRPARGPRGPGELPSDDGSDEASLMRRVHRVLSPHDDISPGSWTRGDLAFYGALRVSGALPVSGEGRLVPVMDGQR